MWGLFHHTSKRPMKRRWRVARSWGEPQLFASCDVANISNASLWDNGVRTAVKNIHQRNATAPKRQPQSTSISSYCKLFDKIMMYSSGFLLLVVSGTNFISLHICFNSNVGHYLDLILLIVCYNELILLLTYETFTVFLFVFIVIFFVFRFLHLQLNLAG